MDERWAAIKTLMSAYWSSKGWKDAPGVDDESLHAAIRAGVMYRAERSLLHDDLVAEISGERARADQ